MGIWAFHSGYNDIVKYVFGKFCSHSYWKFGVDSNEYYQHRNENLYPHPREDESYISILFKKKSKVENIFYDVGISFNPKNYSVYIRTRMWDNQLKDIKMLRLLREKGNNLLKGNTLLNRLFEFSIYDESTGAHMSFTNVYNDNSEDELVDKLFSELNFAFDLVSDFYASLFSDNKNAENRLNSIDICSKSIIDTMNNYEGEGINSKNFMPVAVEYTVGIGKIVQKLSKYEDPILMELYDNREFQYQLTQLALDTLKLKRH